MFNISKYNPIIAWWSGGVTSAFACRFCLNWFGNENVRIIFIDTHNEDDDTYRFKAECEKWYEKDIEIICSDKYKTIQDVWYDNLSLNVATGAVCSYYLKRVVREKFEKENNFSFQSFGFDIKEINRAKGMKENNPKSKAIFPLIYELLTKKECTRILEKENNLFHPLRLPRAYYEGYHNNNCFKTGCVQGGIGYWQKIKREYPQKFDEMAKIEHEISERKGKIVTILRQEISVKGDKIKIPVFLKPNLNHPEIKDLSMLRDVPMLQLLECNGFCGTNDLEINKSIYELNIS